MNKNYAFYNDLGHCIATHSFRYEGCDEALNEKVEDFAAAIGAESWAAI
jgi:hypothetical protein